MRLALGVTIMLLLLAPGADARSSDAPGCGVATQPACWAETFGCRMVLNETGQCLTEPARPTYTTCENHGIIVAASILGHASYCESGSCYNRGVVILVGESSSCFGEADHLLFCVGTLCGCVCYFPLPVETEVSS